MAKIDRIIFYSRELDIAWSDNPLYWKWIEVIDEQNGQGPWYPLVEVAELLEVYSLEVRKKVEAGKLLADIEYEAVFQVKMNEDGSGWDVPVNLEWKMLDSEEKEHIVHQDMRLLPKGEWVEVHVGTFMGAPKDFEFSMYELTNRPKKGLVVKSLVIKPVKK